MTLNAVIERRNDLVARSVRMGRDVADECWVRLGTVNIIIDRAMDNEMQLPSNVEAVVETCLRKTETWMDSRNGTGS